MNALIDWIASHAVAGGTLVGSVIALLFAIRTIFKQDKTIAAKEAEIAEHKLKTETQVRVNEMLLSHADAREREIRAEAERQVRAQIEADLTEDIKKPPTTDAQWSVEAKDLLDESKK